MNRRQAHPVVLRPGECLDCRLGRFHIHYPPEPDPEPATLAEWAVAIAGGIAAFVAFWVAVVVAIAVWG